MLKSKIIRAPWQPHGWMFKFQPVVQPRHIANLYTDPKSIARQERRRRRADKFMYGAWYQVRGTNYAVYRCTIPHKVMEHIARFNRR